MKDPLWVVSMILLFGMESISDLIRSNEGQVAAGDTVVSGLNIKGTHTAAYQGIPAAGGYQEISIPAPVFY